MNEVNILTKIDVLRALRNGLIERLCSAEIDVEFYKWKKDHLANGQDKNKVKEQQKLSEQNVQTAKERISICDNTLKALDITFTVENYGY